jgi:hypothetical protein
VRALPDAIASDAMSDPLRAAELLDVDSGRDGAWHASEIASATRRTLSEVLGFRIIFLKSGAALRQ